jgi:hypothetical protein
MDDVPDHIKGSMDFLFADKMDHVLELALDG